MPLVDAVKYLFLRAENTHERNDTRNPVGWRHTKALLLKQQKVILYHLEIEITIGIAVFGGMMMIPEAIFMCSLVVCNFAEKKIHKNTSTTRRRSWKSGR